MAPGLNNLIKAMRSTSVKTVLCGSALALVIALGFVAIASPLDQVEGQSISMPTVANESVSPGVNADVPATAQGPANDAFASLPSDSADGSGSEYEPGCVLAMLSEGASPDGVAAAIAEFPSLEGVKVADADEGFVKLSLPAGLSVEDAVESVAHAEGVASAQPNYRYSLQDEVPVVDSAQMVVNATLAAGSAGSALDLQVSANDPKRAHQWALESMNVPSAWNTVTSVAPTSKYVTVAVIDSGFLTTHEDLANVVVGGYNAAKKSTKASLYGSAEIASHGTHVAGIVAAQANNGKGIAGVAYNTSSYSTCKVLPVRVMDDRGYIYTSTLVTAYNWLLKHKSDYNVRVVNMSLGSSRDDKMDSSDYLLGYAINKAWREGIVSVAAACNIVDGFNYTPFFSYPSDLTNVVSVISLEQSNNSDGVERDPTSNFNASGSRDKDISAPGDDILSLSSVSTRSYRYTGGTSMAAPAVAGVLALEFKANPKLTAPEAVSKLYSTAKDLTGDIFTSTGWDRATGYGEADAAAAVSTTAAYLSGSTTVSAGKKLQMSVKINGKKQAASSWTWTTSNSSIARVSSTGEVVGVSAGEVTIAARKGSQVAYQTVEVFKGSTHVSTLGITVSSKAYTGKARKPAPTVRDGSTLLTRGVHYTVSYSNNKNPGRATVKVTGIYPYYGSTTKTFTIKPMATKVTKLKAAKRGLKVTWKKRTKQTTGYQLQIATNKTFTKNKHTYRKASTRVVGATLSNLKAKKRYYVRVRTYKRVSGKNYYSAWSKVRTVKTK